MPKKFLNYREYIIAGLVILAMIIVGSFVDLGFSQSVYNVDTTSWYGIIMSAIGEIPAYLITVISGGLFIVASQGLKKWQQIIFWIIGIGLTLFGGYYVYHCFLNFASFNRTGDTKTLVMVIAIVIAVSLVGITDFLLIRYTYKKDRHLLRAVAFIMITIFFLQIGLVTGLKTIIARPRPRYILGSYGTTNEFRNWWEWQPFANIKNATEHLEKDNWQSCPSGHSATALATAFALPALTMLVDNWRNNKKIRAIAFHIGLTWGLIVAFSRVYAGAHFLSDVGLGLLVCLLSGLIVQIVLPYIIKE